MEQKGALENIKLHYKSKNAAIDLFDEYSLIASEAKRKRNYKQGLKILTQNISKCFKDYR